MNKIKPTSVRLPDGLMDRIKAEAIKNERSAGREMSFRLAQSFRWQESLRNAGVISSFDADGELVIHRISDVL